MYPENYATMLVLGVLGLLAMPFVLWVEYRGRKRRREIDKLGNRLLRDRIRETTGYHR